MANDIDIEYVAQLARVDLTDAEKQRYALQLEDVLAHCEKIKAVDVDHIEPMSHAFPIYNVWDADTPKGGLAKEEALRNAPEASEGYWAVPKVIEEA